MILESIPVKSNGEIFKTAKVLCKCECGLKFKRTVSAALKNTMCKPCTIIAYNKSRDPSIHKKMVENAAKTWTGKTREQVCGPEKAKLASLKQSMATSGSNNPNYGGKYSRGFADNPLTGKWEDVFGEDEARRRKAAHSARISGSGNPMYGKPSPKRSGNGISGWIDDRLYFRSLLELRFILKCEMEGININSAEKALYRVNYVFDGNDRTYVPDFVDDAGILYECKPSKLLNSRIVKAKVAAAPHVKIITEHMLNELTYPELQFLISSGRVKIDKSKMNRIRDHNDYNQKILPKPSY